MFRSSLTFLLMAGTALGSAAAALAQEVLELEQITVIGTGLPTEVMKSPASITVISAETLGKTAPVSIASLLRDVPGVQINEEGIERVSIRGETSRRVAILIDGQKLTDHTNYGQPILVDPTTIERIEVLRGSSAVVSGSRAIGGVINIITKRGADRPFEFSTTAGYMSATDGYRFSASAAGTLAAGAGAFDYRLNFGRMDQGDRKTPDGTLEPSDTQDRNLSGHLGYRMGQHYFGLRAQRYDLAANVYTGEPDFRIELPHRDLRKISTFYEGTDLTPWLTRLSADLYRQTIDREFTNDISVAAGPMQMRVLSGSEDAQETSGLNLRAEMSFSPNTRTVAGLEFEDDRLTSDKLTDTTMTPPGFVTSTARRDEAKIETLSVFAQHEIDLTQELTATFGGRWYDVTASHLGSSTNGVENPTSDASDSLALGSMGLVYSPSESLAFRANLSQGYIYPTLGQMFLTTTGGGQTIVGNPGLDPETSTTFELGARYSTGATMVDATVFYTGAKDYIATAPVTGTIYTYQNVDEARSWGLELHAGHELEQWGLTPYVSVAALRRELTYSNGFSTFDSGSPEFAGRIGVRKGWQTAALSGMFDLFLRGESAVDYRGSSGTIAASAAGYGTLNLRSDVDFGNDLSLVAELNNLTDRSYSPYAQLPGAERSINLFLTKTF
ncbi:TonB-dependent receptor (plasmid) [Cereibacter azotoformans]|uniref:TonB-dependent receptor n=1 Tax=Cereibacter azotoformans TaxID=43057 RepID=UPI001EEBC3D1|nr:TonB-dependent receptor [Cereibacter azotoformans]ULB12425.1 TonB-dependent receptor [Cereibacter azotoformans]